MTCLQVNRAAGDWLFVVGPIVLKCEYRPACDWLWEVSVGAGDVRGEEWMGKQNNKNKH